MPLNAHDEAPAGHLDPFDDAVVGAVGGRDEPRPEPSDRLMVNAVHGNRTLADGPREPGPRPDIDRVDPPRARFGTVVPFPSCYD